VRALGVDPDLVVRPVGWKVNVASLSVFNRFAAGMEVGVQPIEDVGRGIDGDFDGVVDELDVADMSALTVYLAAQPRPTTRIELTRLRRAFEAAGMTEQADDLGIPPALQPAEIVSIRRGSLLFRAIGCADCHRPALKLDDPVFREPSALPAFREDVFPNGVNAVEAGLDPASPLLADLTRDPPDNRFRVGKRTLVLGTLQRLRGGLPAPAGQQEAAGGDGAVAEKGAAIHGNRLLVAVGKASIWAAFPASRRIAVLP